MGTPVKKTIHPSTTISHVHLTVGDLERSLRFYRDTLGLQILEKNLRIVRLTADGVIPLITLEEETDAQPKPPGTMGLYHFAILLPERTDLARCLQHLLEIELPLGASDHQFSEALYLKDPDGNGIEIYTDRPRNQWRQNEKDKLPAVSDPLDMAGLLSLAGNRTWNEFPEKTRIGHIHLHVGDLKKAEQFYCEGLGFEPTIRWNGALFVAAGGYHHHIGLNTWAGEGAPPPPPKSVGLQHFSLIAPNWEEIKRVAQQLKGLGIPIEVQEETLWVTDPFGIRIQLSAAN
ncbi:VOC family protein [Salinithrix halophila]|uniref:VOC family protein n=1 Tax=Salinithrix halophila TaxID=1485204 RepID=A0ABV8JCK1_9BACL